MISKEYAKALLQEVKSRTPKYWWAPDYDMKDGEGADGVKALFIESVEYKGKPTRVFCYYGAPKGREGEKFPAMVLVHGGGGVAYSDWVKMWVDRGYAAIAVDTCGRLPLDEYKGLRYSEGRIVDDKVIFDNHDYPQFAPLDGEIDGYVSGPYNDAFSTTHTKSIEEQWIYHALSSIIVARSVVGSFSEVDDSRVGVIGLSYGGMLVSQLINHDDRYRFAIPAYGSAYIPQGGNWPNGGADQNRSHRLYGVYDVWDANEILPDLKFPVYWSAWDKDDNFSPDAVSMSYMATKSNGSLISIIPDYDHSHCHVWIREEFYKYADYILKGGEDLVRVVTEPEGFGKVSFKLNIPNGENVKAYLQYTDKPITYHVSNRVIQDNTWYQLECNVDGDIVSVDIPENAHTYYITIEWYEKRKMVVSTRLVIRQDKKKYL